MTFLDELVAAGRGVAALAIGDRNVARHFDFSPRGLSGSFIALLLITALTALVPAIMGAPDSGVGQSVWSAALLFVLQLGLASIALGQIGRLDGVMAYVIADNWASFFISLLSAALSAIGLPDQAALLLMAILVLVIEINIARLLLKLAPLQIAMFIIAQLAGVAIALALISMLFPLPGETAALATQ